MMWEGGSLAGQTFVWGNVWPARLGGKGEQAG